MENVQGSTQSTIALDSRVLLNDRYNEEPGHYLNTLDYIHETT